MMWLKQLVCMSNAGRPLLAGYRRLLTVTILPVAMLLAAVLISHIATAAPGAPASIASYPLVASATLTPTPTQVACIPGWSAVPPPDLALDNEFTAVSALSQDDIWAAGDYGVEGGRRTLIERWDGHIWTIVPSPNVGSADNHLEGLAAVSSTDAWAVGDYHDVQAGESRTLVLHWDGSQWAQVDAPSPFPGSGGSFLTSVAVVSATDVWAVGFAISGPLTSRPISLHWEGTTWQAVAGLSGEGRLYSVAALAAGNVWAVGTEHGTLSTLVEHWDGSSWQVVPSPDPCTTGDNGLLGIAAAAANDVWAVGTCGAAPNLNTLVLHWDGSQWTRVPSPSPASTSRLLAITATSASDAWAVGETFDGSQYQPLIERWDGSQWVQASQPVPSLPNPFGLTAIAATSSGYVLAVGSWVQGSVTQTVAMQWDGQEWYWIQSANEGSNEQSLSGVAAISSNDVWAVGYQSDGQLGRNLALHWDGSNWTAVSVPNYGPYSNQLSAVAASGSDDAWAAGSYCDAWTHTTKGLVLHWNGSGWAVSGTFDLGPGSVSLHSIAAMGPNDVWVVGDYLVPGIAPRESVALHWNGQQWLRTSTPNPGTASNRLSGVTALPTGEVWAVGDYDYNPGQFALILHWDGSVWSQIAGPNLPPGNQFLNSVSATSSNDIWAVGYYCQVECGPGHNDETLIVHWDGFQWVRVASPTRSEVTFLLGVSTVSSTLAWAVGWSSSASPALIERWDGNRWAEEEISGPLSEATLEGVAAVSPVGAWAVGYDRDPIANVDRPVLGHYTECPASTPTPAPSSTPVPSSTPAASPSPTSTTTSTPMQSPTQSPTTVGPTTSPTMPAPGTSTATTMPTGTTTPTPCALSFTDVPPDSTFYPYVRCLACRGIVSGYSDGTFRPGNNITRGQIAKVVSSAANLQYDVTGRQTYADVPGTHTFWLWIERLTAHYAMSGYPCGGPGEPCDEQNRPYFRPANNATRAQLAKIVSNTAGYSDPPGSQIFADVPPAHDFYFWIQRLATRGILGGYPCGGPGEPCDSQNRPYFRPGNSVTRGQAAKIVANTFFPGCQTPSRR